MSDEQGVVERVRRVLDFVRTYDSTAELDDVEMYDERGNRLADGNGRGFTSGDLRAILAELEEARKDGERLSWLERNSEVFWKAIEMHVGAELFEADDDEDKDTLRARIDYHLNKS